MTDKKLTVKRIIIYCILSVTPLAIGAPVISHILGEPLYTGEAASSVLTSLLGIFGMCAPAAANLLTRLITKEGFESVHLGFSLRNGKWKYYLLGILVPLAYAFIGFVLVKKIILGDMSFGEAFDNEYLELTPWLVLSQIGVTIFMMLPYFGEEFGWRGYLTPKLTELMGEPAAIAVNGIIWGLWHAPLTIYGHNFGVDYKGFPYLGILMMCLMCVLISPFLTLVTKRTGSVLPAAVAHGINNNTNAGLFITLLATEKAAENFAAYGVIKYFLITLIPIAAVGIASFAIILRENSSRCSNQTTSR